MRITRRNLIDLAHREANRRAAEEDILSAYLIGSTVRGEPLLGGKADIDLVLIHENPPVRARETIALSDDVHLDIAHHDRTPYSQPRNLRTSPWLGPALYDPLFLLDPKHFLEWAQASARSQFNRADYRAARARALLHRARDELAGSMAPGRPWPAYYTRAVLDGANAVVSLVGAPAAGRRLTLSLKQRLDEAGHPEIFEGFLGLIGAPAADRTDLSAWTSAWGQALAEGHARSDDPRLAPCRVTYYLSGYEALVDIGWPQAVVWPLLSTWQTAVEAIGSAKGPDENRLAWEGFLEELDLSLESAQPRIAQLERFLDGVEDIIENWGSTHGA